VEDTVRNGDQLLVLGTLFFLLLDGKENDMSTNSH